MELWQVCFSNTKSLRIKAKKKDLLKTGQGLISVRSAESEEETNILLNLDNVLWMMKVDEKEL